MNPGLIAVGIGAGFVALVAIRKAASDAAGAIGETARDPNRGLARIFLPSRPESEPGVNAKHDTVGTAVQKVANPNYENLPVASGTSEEIAAAMGVEYVRPVRRGADTGAEDAAGQPYRYVAPDEVEDGTSSVYAYTVDTEGGPV